MAKAYEILRHLKAEELVRPVEAGKYLLLGFQPERVLSNPMFIATRLAHPAYVSYWSGLHFHGLTEQVPRTVFVATTRKRRPLEFDGARFVSFCLFCMAAARRYCSRVVRLCACSTARPATPRTWISTPR